MSVTATRTLASVNCQPEISFSKGTEGQKSAGEPQQNSSWASMKDILHFFTVYTCGAVLGATIRDSVGMTFNTFKNLYQNPNLLITNPWVLPAKMQLQKNTSIFSRFTAPTYTFKPIRSTAPEVFLSTSIFAISMCAAGRLYKKILTTEQKRSWEEPVAVLSAIATSMYITTVALKNIGYGCASSLALDSNFIVAPMMIPFAAVMYNIAFGQTAKSQ